MNDEIDMNEVSEEYAELEALKARADLLGVKYHPNTGVDKLRAKINNAISGNPNDTGDSRPVKANNVNSFRAITHEEFKAEQRAIAKKRANSLIRINITCMNPSKKEWEGEIISVGSAKLGTYKKYIPFNTTDGWHVPYIIYEALKERKCSVFHTVKDHLGNKIRKSKLINEFSIEVLPPLTPKELKELAQRQAMAKGEE